MSINEKVNSPTETSGSGRYYEVRISSTTNPAQSDFVGEFKTLDEANAIAKELHGQGKAAFVRYPQH